jgi:hypothetical protein
MRQLMPDRLLYAAIAYDDDRVGELEGRATRVKAESLSVELVTGE